jgi:hypothetical protein
MRERESFVAAVVVLWLSFRRPINDFFGQFGLGFSVPKWRAHWGRRLRVAVARKHIVGSRSVCARTQRVELRRYDDDDDDDDSSTVAWIWRAGKRPRISCGRTIPSVAHSITVNLPVDDDALPFFHAARRAGQVLPPTTQVRNLCVALDLFNRHNPNIHERVWIRLTFKRCPSGLQRALRSKDSNYWVLWKVSRELRNDSCPCS